MPADRASADVRVSSKTRAITAERNVSTFSCVSARNQRSPSTSSTPSHSPSAPALGSNAPDRPPAAGPAHPSVTRDDRAPHRDQSTHSSFTRSFVRSFILPHSSSSLRVESFVPLASSTRVGKADVASPRPLFSRSLFFLSIGPMPPF